MPSNVHYQGPADLPEEVPVFPLPGILLLPRGHLPLNIFEPRYLSMVDDVLGGSRLIGILQPRAEEGPEADLLARVGCIGRITEFSETGDGRYLITLTGIARFRLVEEVRSRTAYRRARVDFMPFEVDFQPRTGEDDVDRDALVKALRAFSEAREVEVDWGSVARAPTEALVNALSMMSPYGAKEKQALLEAPDLKTRSELLVAITEIELSGPDGGSDITMQ